MESNRILHYRYNFIYIIGILTLAIILLLTIKWTNLPNLVEYILFSLAITSITLSVITIIYAIFSNFSLSRSIYMINEASSSLEKSTTELEDSIELVNKNILNIPKKLTEVGKDIKKEIEPAIRSAMQKNKIDTEVIVPKKDDGKFDIKFIDLFIPNNSVSGALVCYAAFQSYINKAQFTFEEITEIIGTTTEYIWGQTVAQSACGLYNLKVLKGKNYKINRFDGSLEKIIKDKVNEKVEKFIKKNIEETWMSEETKTQYRNVLGELEKLFQNKKKSK